MPNPIPNASPAIPTATNLHPNPASHDHAAAPPWSVPTQEPDGTAGVDQTTNQDCLALGCDWDWGPGLCECGQWHTFRICRRCQFSDDPVCAADGDHDDPAVTP
jgi:hypothetical protein